MNKIGIKITKISGGVQELETFNGGDWTRKVSDIRSDMKLLDGKALEDGTPILMLSFLTKGCLITVCHAIPGRAGDLVSAWIHIPAEIAISAEEECAVIEQVEAELAKSNVENWDTIARLCEKEYPYKTNPFPYRESIAANPCAVRYYGAGTDFKLHELLGDLRYQAYYTEHRYVFLIDKSSGIIADDKLVNYTDEPLREFLVVLPPQLPDGITVLLNGNEFAKPILAIKGEKIPLTYERQGFNAVPCQVTVGSPMPDPAGISWQRHITPSMFHVTDNEGRNLDVSCRISLRGQFLSQDGVNIPEEDCKAVKVEVESFDCEPYNDTLNLLRQDSFHIVMEREKVNILYTLHGKECPNLTECPEGYAYTERRQGKKLIRDCYYVEPEAGPNWKLFTIVGSAAALIIGLALGVLLHKFIADRSEVTDTEVVRQEVGNKDNKNETKENTAPKPVVYECLNKDVWKKAELDSVPDLNGFFRDVQKCNVERLTVYWAEKINSQYHPQWASLLNEIRKYDATQLRDFQMGNNDQEIQLKYYKKKLTDWVSARGQSGSVAPAIPPTRSATSASSPNKPASDNSGKKKPENNKQAQGDL